jgi:hypothetical protein
MYSTSLQCTVPVCNVQYLFAMYSTSLQCTVPVCNVQYQFAIYSTCLQCTVPVCNVQYLFAMYSISLQCTVPVCNVQYLFAMYSTCLQCTCSYSNSLYFSIFLLFSPIRYYRTLHCGQHDQNFVRALKSTQLQLTKCIIYHVQYGVRYISLYNTQDHSVVSR